MEIDYLGQFPVPPTQLTSQLRSLLEPVSVDPLTRIDVARRSCSDLHGPNSEYLHMIMALVPEHKLGKFGIPHETSSGLVCQSKPDVAQKGKLGEFTPSISGNDYIVAAWGSGNFFSFNLSEKVWMALGLSPRCIGGEQQQMIYDDLSRPEFDVAKGEISSQYYFSPDRDVCWTMSNEYVRRYLWMRGTFGVRVFFYEALLQDCPELRELMDGQTQRRIKPNDGWYDIDIREHDGKLLLQVWASVAAVPPALCSVASASELIWPGFDGPMTQDRANSLTHLETVYLDDQFLERYEQSSFYNTTPVINDGQCSCSPSYQGQWTFSGCVRIGRNAIRVPIRNIYDAIPDREIIHAHGHALTPAQVKEIDQDEEHIVFKAQRFLNQVLDLGDNLAKLGDIVGSIAKPADKIVGISRDDVDDYGWSKYPELLRIAQVVPLTMTEQAFLSRCKDIHEFWQRVPNGFLRELLVAAGHDASTIKSFRCLKLLQALLNIVERLNTQCECADAFETGSDQGDLTSQNTAITPLFVTFELRKADAHSTGEYLRHLERLGFDVAALSLGHGRAFDYVFNGVIGSFCHLNEELSTLLTR